MPVALDINQQARTATITVTLDITKILSETQSITDQTERTRTRRLRIGAEAMSEIGRARQGIRRTDAELDADLAAKQAEYAAIKAARPAAPQQATFEDDVEEDSSPEPEVVEKSVATKKK